ncbi:pyruvate synthase subunit beta [candidate division WOR-3 bacterium]|uniref:Pyruvate synthase subunit beta n=1 Tax=candidate division WOR-3 bacterium TaxID=2052148 RepID=A0A9D5K905_UNCW3|nr:pyruvate synthase subunit beta [candidate division WOR-3 bacterium]MBD3364582.1 pyruvate synthase subunit beta [candidate division WOR-3 bacterium]
MKYTIPAQEVMCSGHKACQGCGAALAMRYALKALGPRTIMTFPACCWSVIDGPFPYSAVGVPLFHTAFETAAVVASGIRAGLDARGEKDVNVVAWAGDGGTFDIGIQALSGTTERNDNIIYVCYDNEAYMNTGVQRSSATPWGAVTTTTPPRHFKKERKKDMMAILAAHSIPYTASASVAYPEDFIKKLNYAKSIEGTKFLHILATCPPGWRSAPEIAVQLAKLAVQTHAFPLYEIHEGRYFKMSMNPAKKPLTDYLKPQGRFRHLTEEQVADMDRMIDERYSYLLEQAERSKPYFDAKKETK